MEHRNLSKLLRDAERRVNAHVFKTGGDDSLASIPANRDRDVDLLLMEAAEKLDLLSGALETLLPGLVLDLRYADLDDDKDAMQSRIETVTEALAAMNAVSASGDSHGS